MPQIHPQTETAVANEALSLIRQPPIGDLASDTTKPARVLRTHFAAVRDALLRKYPWNFAESYQQLNALPTKPPFRFNYAYALPQDCLKAIEIEGCRGLDRQRTWKVQGRQIVTNVGPVINLIYTRNETSVAVWDALFREAFAIALASRAAPEIAKDEQVSEAVMQQSAQALEEAFPVDAGEGAPEEMPDGDILDARF